MAEQMYLQCELVKEIDGGVECGGSTQRMVSWIRQEIAVVGNVLDGLKDTSNGLVRDGWTVANVTGPAMAERFLVERSHEVVFPSLERKKKGR